MPYLLPPFSSDPEIKGNKSDVLQSMSSLSVHWALCTFRSSLVLALFPRFEADDQPPLDGSFLRGTWALSERQHIALYTRYPPCREVRERSCKKRHKRCTTLLPLESGKWKVPCSNNCCQQVAQEAYDQGRESQAARFLILL